MGLDMFLIKKTYVGAEYDHLNIKVKIKITKNGKDIPINPKRITYIFEEVGCWRKANHIHNWFIVNCAKGIDDQAPVYVLEDDLKKLLDVCRQVQADNTKANELLPTKSGFFFGGTDYDEYYFRQIAETIGIIEPLLKEIQDAPFVDIEYQASW